MILSRVMGQIVSTVKNPHLKGYKLLLVQPVDLDTHSAIGASLIALDHVDSGEGDLVLVNKEGGGARIVLKNEEIPVQAVIVAVVDGIDVQEPEVP